MSQPTKRVVILFLLLVSISLLSINSYGQGGSAEKTPPPPSTKQPTKSSQPVKRNITSAKGNRSNSPAPADATKSKPIIIANADLNGEYVFTLPSAQWRIIKQEKTEQDGNVSVNTQLMNDDYKTFELVVVKNVYNLDTKVSELSMLLDAMFTNNGKATKQKEEVFNGNLKGVAITYSGSAMGKESPKVYILQADNRTLFMIIAGGSNTELAQAIPQAEEIVRSIHKK